MSTQVKPEDSQENEQNQNEQQENSNQDTKEQPPKNEPDPRLALYEQMARESSQREIALNNRLAQLENSVRNPEVKPEPLTANDLLNDPEKLVNRIRGEIERAVAPLNAFKDSFTKENEFDKAKNRLKSDPNFGKYFTKLEPYIDQSRDKMEPTDANMRALALSLVGSIQMGLIPGVSLNDDPAPNPNPNPGNGQQQNNSQQNNNMSNAPAHLRPSAPDRPTNNSNNNQGNNNTVRGILGRELNETEKKMARYYNQTELEYAQFLVLPASEVPSSRIGIPEKK